MGSKANEELGIRPFQVNRTRVSECSEGGLVKMSRAPWRAPQLQKSEEGSGGS